MLQKIAKVSVKYICDKCWKEYVHQPNLFRHKKTCKLEEKEKEKEVIDTMDNKIDKIIETISEKIHLTEGTREKLIK